MVWWRRAAFFDRDGTINVDIGYLHRTEDIRFVPGVPELIKKYNDIEYLVIVITNQSGIARGMFTEDDMRCVNDAMNRRLLNEYGAHIDAFYYCPHLPEYKTECDCRKPKPGLLLQAAEKYNIDLAASWMIGDSDSDVQAGEAAGCRTVKLADGMALPEAVKAILAGGNL